MAAMMIPGSARCRALLFEAAEEVGAGLAEDEPDCVDALEVLPAVLEVEDAVDVLELDPVTELAVLELDPVPELDEVAIDDALAVELVGIALLVVVEVDAGLVEPPNVHTSSGPRGIWNK